MSSGMWKLLPPLDVFIIGYGFIQTHICIYVYRLLTYFCESFLKCDNFIHQMLLLHYEVMSCVCFLQKRTKRKVLIKLFELKNIGIMLKSTNKWFPQSTIQGFGANFFKSLFATLKVKWLLLVFKVKSSVQLSHLLDYLISPIFIRRFKFF